MAPELAKDKIVRTAKELVLVKGFPATTVDEICEAAGVSKGSFYHSFRSKEELGLALLDEYWAEGQRVMDAGSFMHQPDPRKRLQEFFDHIEQSSEHLWGRGCLLGSFAMDLAETSPRMQMRVSEIYSAAIARLAPVFEAAEVVAGKRMSAADLVRQFLGAVEGAILFAKGHQDIRYLHEGIRNFRALVAPGEPGEKNEEEEGRHLRLSSG